MRSILSVALLASALVAGPAHAACLASDPEKTVVAIIEKPPAATDEPCGGRLVKLWVTEKKTIRPLQDGSTEITTSTTYEMCIDPAMRQSLLGSMEAVRQILESGQGVTVWSAKQSSAALKSAAGTSARAADWLWRTLVPTANAAPAPHKRGPR